MAYVCFVFSGVGFGVMDLMRFRVLRLLKIAVNYFMRKYASKKTDSTMGLRAEASGLSEIVASDLGFGFNRLLKLF